MKNKNSPKANKGGDASDVSLHSARTQWKQQLQPGTTVNVTQQIPHRDRVWSNEVLGSVVCYEQKQTGSWYAHSKDDRLWLDRLTLRKTDGEITTLNLDEFSKIDIVSNAPAGAAGKTVSEMEQAPSPPDAPASSRSNIS